MRKLNYENLYYIGGVVRDEILGKNSFDVDLTYVGDAIEFCKKLEEKSIGKIIKENGPFGTARMLIDREEIDIASTRDEIYEKKGHLPTVTEIGCSLKKDVLRRDFTVNALAKSTLTGEIIDYTGGLKDIEAKTLRVLHDNSFIDDPTRIIRGLKFSVRFGFKLDENTKKLQEKYLDNINYDMSYKRVKKELTETFNLNSQLAFDKFFKQGIYKLLTQEDIVPPKYDIETLVKKYNPDNVWLVYIGWMNLGKLPLTKQEQKIIDDYSALMDAKIENNDYSIYKNFKGKEKESILLYMIMKDSQKGQRFFEIENIQIQITGEDLKEIGITPSKKYSDCFDYILKEKLKNPDMSKSDEIGIAKYFFIHV